MYGGSYAYVIRADRESAPPGQPRSRGGPDPAPTAAFAISEGQTQDQAQDTAYAYGPDDPAYGPPRPVWRAPQEAAGPRVAEEEPSHTRGAFEPLPPGHIVSEPPGYTMDEDEAAAGEPLGYEADVPGMPGDVPDEAEPEVDIALVGRGDGPLERIKDLYQTAEAFGESRLDKHFEQLLERQRQLIRDYFTESGSRPPAGSGFPDEPAPRSRNRADTGDLSLGGARGSRR